MQRGQPAPAPARRERVNSHKSLSQKHISSSQKRDDAAGRRRALDDAKADAISSARTTARRGFRIRRPEPKPRATPGLAHERVDDVAPHNTTDRLQERARRLPPSFPNKCNRSPRRPRRQQDRASTPPKPLATMRFRHRGVPETKCRNTTPHPTHPARHPRHESDGRVAQGPDAASRDQKTNHNPHRHETPPIGPHSHQRPPHTPFAALHVYNGQYKDHRQFSAQWFCGIISIYLNHSAR